MRRHPFIFTLQWTSFARRRAGVCQMRTVSGRTECLPHCASRAHSISSSSQSSRKTNLSCIHFASRRPLKSSATWPTVWSWNNVGKYQCRAKGHLCIKLAELTHHDHVSLQGNQRFEIPTLNQLHDKITRNFCCCEICSISPFPRNFNAFLFKAQNTPPPPPPLQPTLQWEGCMTYVMKTFLMLNPFVSARCYGNRSPAIVLTYEEFYWW